MLGAKVGRVIITINKGEIINYLISISCNGKPILSVIIMDRIIIILPKIEIWQKLYGLTMS